LINDYTEKLDKIILDFVQQDSILMGLRYDEHNLKESTDAWKKQRDEKKEEWMEAWRENNRLQVLL